MEKVPNSTQNGHFTFSKGIPGFWF